MGRTLHTIRWRVTLNPTYLEDLMSETPTTPISDELREARALLEGPNAEKYATRLMDLVYRDLFPEETH